MVIRKLVKPHVRLLRPYEAAEIPCRVKLDANESPYGFKVLKSVPSNRYPDPEAKLLRKLIARILGVGTENILHGNGSDELIYYLITAFGGPVLYPTPTFSMYGIIAQALGEKRVEVPLDKSFDLDINSMSTIIKKISPRLIFLSTPNNPTGNSFSPDRIKKIIKQAGGLVVVDEAYQEFSPKKSFVPLLKKQKNLVILRTLSKVGLAGLRVGFLIADSEITQEVNKVRLPFNLNAVSQRIATHAIKNRRRMKNNIKRIVSERKRLFREMTNMHNVDPFASDANFILFRLKDSDRIYKGLLKKGVLVRNMRGIVNDCLRVTIGTKRENRFFLKALNQLLP